MKPESKKWIIRSPQTKQEFEYYYLLRWKVLRKPWNLPRGDERDELEATSDHVAAFDGKKIIGCGRIHLNSSDEAQIRYMAVDENYQGKGIGGSILKELERLAKKKVAKYVILNARASAVEFYRKYGYSIVEKSHTLFGSVEHWKMKKDLV